MLQSNYPLLELNTFHMHVHAKWFSSFKTEQELRSLLEHQTVQQEKVLILGGGSNILFTEDFEGVVLKNEWKGIAVTEETPDRVHIEVGAGEVWHELVLYAVNKGWGGIENMSLIPGSVGASPIQNIGAYGVEVKDVLSYVDAMHVETLDIRRFSNQECKFGYRDSIFKRAEKGKWVITKVGFILSKDASPNTSYGAINDTLNKKGITSPTIKDVSDAVISIRQSKLPDPSKIGNCGSFFKNPEISKTQFESLQALYPDMICYPINDAIVKVPAGWLIEKAGWKGKTFGNYGVHKDQALVLVNYKDASGDLIKHLALDITHSIWEKFGIQLETEVNII